MKRKGTKPPARGKTEAEESLEEMLRAHQREVERDIAAALGDAPERLAAECAARGLPFTFHSHDESYAPPRAKARETPYASLEEAKRELRKACIAEVDARSGVPGTGTQLEQELRAVQVPDDHPRRVWRALADAMIAAAELVANRDAPRTKYFADLAGFVADKAERIENMRKLVACEDGPGWGGEGMERRTLIVARGLGRRLWWSDDGPTDRDLALLVILSGELSGSLVNNYQTIGGPHEAISAEARAVGLARKRIEAEIAKQAARSAAATEAKAESRTRRNVAQGLIWWGQSMRDFRARQLRAARRERAARRGLSR